VAVALPLPSAAGGGEQAASARTPATATLSAPVTVRVPRVIVGSFMVETG